MTRHNHATRDIKQLGKCPACDAYHQRKGETMTEQNDPIAKTVSIHEDKDRFGSGADRQIKVECPYCGENHTHGYPKKGEALTISHRGAHCGKGGYFLDKEKT